MPTDLDDLDPERLPPEPPRAEQFVYFMVRAQRSSLESPACTLVGLIERLATGEKESFASAEELLRIVCRRPDPIHQMRTPGTPGDA